MGIYREFLIFRLDFLKRRLGYIPDALWDMEWQKIERFSLEDALQAHIAFRMLEFGASVLGLTEEEEKIEFEKAKKELS